EVPPPEVVAQNRHRLRILQVRCVRGQDIAAEKRRHAEILESIPSKVDRCQVLRNITASDDEVPPVHGDYVFDCACLPQLPNLRPGKAWPTLVASLVEGVDLTDSVKPGIRPSVEDGTVNYAEDRNGRTDPERQRQDCGQRKARSSRHQAKGKAQVLQELPHKRLAKRRSNACPRSKQL